MKNININNLLLFGLATFIPFVDLWDSNKYLILTSFPFLYLLLTGYVFYVIIYFATK